MTRPTLRSREQIVQRWRANLTRSRGQLAHGGWLELTSQRLLFVPNSIGPIRDGSPWEIELPDIQSLTVHRQESRAAVFTGGLVEHLVVEGRGSADFIVNNPGQIEDAINQARSRL